MAFTGELEHLHIVDIIQLLHSSRKSGIFSVQGAGGESRIIFDTGNIVGASHFNGRIRIGSVLVKMNIISREDLKEALEIQKKAGKNRKPLISLLIERGKIKQEDAYKGLKKLVEMVIVELIGWTRGTFTLDTEDVAVSAECSYLLGKMVQPLNLDSQMVLMDSLRIFDEKERDRQSGKNVPSDEELFAEEIPDIETVESRPQTAVLTADDLGLADIEKLERKIPQPFLITEIIDPAEVYRRRIQEILSDFPEDEREAYVSFLRKSSGEGAPAGRLAQKGRPGAVFLFSRDQLLRYSVMNILKKDVPFVFATQEEDELEHIIAGSLPKDFSPVVFFDSPGTPETGISSETIVSLRLKLKEKFPWIAYVQLASPLDYDFMMQSFTDGLTMVLPKPAKDDHKETFIRDTIKFLDTLQLYVQAVLRKQNDVPGSDSGIRKLKDDIVALRECDDPDDISSSLLQSVSEIFERSAAFAVHPAELVGEGAIRVYDPVDMEPVSASKLKIPLTSPSVFSQVIESGQIFFGMSDDEVLDEYIYKRIGGPLRSLILLLPVKGRQNVMSLIYGDFGSEEPSPVQLDALEILVCQAGLMLENSVYRTRSNKGS